MANVQTHRRRLLFLPFLLSFSISTVLSRATPHSRSTTLDVSAALDAAARAISFDRYNSLSQRIQHSASTTGRSTLSLRIHSRDFLPSFPHRHTDYKSLTLSRLHRESRSPHGEARPRRERPQAFRSEANGCITHRRGDTRPDRLRHQPAASRPLSFPRSAGDPGSIASTLQQVLCIIWLDEDGNDYIPCMVWLNNTTLHPRLQRRRRTYKPTAAASSSFPSSSPSPPSPPSLAGPLLTPDPSPSTSPPPSLLPAPIPANKSRAR